MLINCNLDIFLRLTVMMQFIIIVVDETLLHPDLLRILERVRQSADFMPVWRMEVSIDLFKDVLIMMYLSLLECSISLDETLHPLHSNIYK